jgi:GT2 family glycosyltransferase
MDHHPSVGIAGTKLLNPDGTRQYSCDLFPRKPLTMLRDKMRDRFSSKTKVTWHERTAKWNFDENFAVDYVIGAALLIRRETYEQIGLLDEQFFMYAEDIDWCYRAALAGWQTYYLGKISVYHYNRGSSEISVEVSTHLRALRKKSLLKFYKKHCGVISSLMMKVILFLKQD